MNIEEQISEILYKSNGTGAGGYLVARLVKKKMKEYAISYIERAAFKTTTITSGEILKLKKQVKNDNL